jgi:addiction module RelB/DinJ family antitoxin
MPNDALLQVRIDAKTKERAAKFFKRFGLSTSDGVRLLITQALRAKELPHVPNAATRRALVADVEPIADDELEKLWNDA